MTLVVDETHQGNIGELWRYAEVRESQTRGKYSHRAIEVDRSHAGPIMIRVKGAGTPETYDIPEGAKITVLDHRRFMVDLPAARIQLTFKLGLDADGQWTVCRRQTEPPRPRRSQPEPLAIL